MLKLNFTITETGGSGPVQLQVTADGGATWADIGSPITLTHGQRTVTDTDDLTIDDTVYLPGSFCSFRLIDTSASILSNVVGHIIPTASYYYSGDSVGSWSGPIGTISFDTLEADPNGVSPSIFIAYSFDITEDTGGIDGIIIASVKDLDTNQSQNLASYIGPITSNQVLRVGFLDYIPGHRYVLTLADSYGNSADSNVITTPAAYYYYGGEGSGSWPASTVVLDSLVDDGAGVAMLAFDINVTAEGQKLVLENDTNGDSINIWNPLPEGAASRTDFPVSYALTPGVTYTLRIRNSDGSLVAESDTVTIPIAATYYYYGGDGAGSWPDTPSTVVFNSLIRNSPMDNRLAFDLDITAPDQKLVLENGDNSDSILLCNPLAEGTSSYTDSPLAVILSIGTTYILRIRNSDGSLVAESNPITL